MTEWLRESQEATKELLKLKDHLIEVERNVSVLSLSISKCLQRFKITLDSTLYLFSLQIKSLPSFLLLLSCRTQRWRQSARLFRHS